jgi:hypothetical protein
MKKLAFIMSILVVFIGCSNKTTTVKPASETVSLSPRGFIYTLPKTGFKVNVESVSSTILPGPYAAFAQKYLGIAVVSTELKAEWAIASLSVNPFTEPDMQMIFAVEPANSSASSIIKLTESGLVIPIRSAFFNESQFSGISVTNFTEKQFSTDLSHTPFIAAERTTHYSRVFQDSAYVKVPVHKTLVIEKSLEDKAREAADFIFSLRKRRFELLSGDADFVAEGKAVEAVLAEISRLEHEYLSLFVGKVQQHKINHSFSYTPANEDGGTVILFRFSASKGVLPLSDLSGSPVVISTSVLEKWQQTDLFNSIATEKGKPRTDAFYYRIPVPVSIKINFGQTELLQKRETAFQFGPLVRMPFNYLIQ